MGHWPLFNLRVVTPRIELAYPTDAQLDRLVTVAAAGIHDPDVMPFSRPWTRKPSPQLQRESLQYHWLQRGIWKPEAWDLNLVTLVDDAVVGSQGLRADDFAVTRTVATGSWLGREYQGRGIGKEMRAAILHLAFAGLGARTAYTSADADNPSSLGVTRALGYSPNGWRWRNREGQPAVELHFQLAREEWERQRRDDIEIIGLESCLDFFGAGAEGDSYRD